MDGDSRRPRAAQGRDGYTVHVDYDPEPAARLQPRRQPEGADAPGGKADADTDGDADDGGSKAASPPTPRWKKLLYAVIGAALMLGLIVAGLLYWLHARQFASTDDAYVDAYISQISAQIGGRVTAVAVQDYQEVRAGQLLVALDQRDLQIKLDQARAQRLQAAAQLEQAQAGLLQQQASVDQAQANVRVSQADQAQARSDLARYRGIDPRAVSRQSVDTAATTTRSADARVDANQQAVAAAQANVKAQQAQIDAAQANLKAADVTVANAELQLSYTSIIAPRDGKLAKRTVNIGDYVNPGQSLLAVVGEDRWVTANFKETQLAGMQRGQAVTVAVDACPDHGLDGTLEAFQPGSGQIFSSLPAENATGNFVKVVQRVPVRISIKQQDAVRCQLSPGMSVVPSVKVR